MRRDIGAAVLWGVFGLACAIPAQAGLYTTDRPLPGPQPDASGTVQPLPWDQLQDQLAFLLKLPQPALLQDRAYQQRLDALLAKKRSESLTTDDRINLGEALIRGSQKPEDLLEAIAVLRPASRGDSRAAANLATAYFLLGEDTTAQEYLLDLWAKKVPDWSDAQHKWYQRAETQLRKLIQLRQRELAAQGPRPKPAETIDALFAAHFVGDSGQFEAGKLAPTEKAKLPPDALALVQQLVVWLPGDTRLYWLLGELYNAQGDLEVAAAIFNQCVDGRRFEAAALRDHRQAVLAALPKEPPPQEEAPTPVPSPILPMTPQNIAIVGVAMVIITTLLFLQFREIMRRRRPGQDLCNCCH